MKISSLFLFVCPRGVRLKFFLYYRGERAIILLISPFFFQNVTISNSFKEVYVVLESEFQRKLKKRIKDEIPGSYVFKQDPNQVQGIADLIIVNGSKYAMLECKKSKDAHHQPNQDYYINDVFGKMTYASFVYPENVDEVIEELKGWFKE